MSKQSFVVSLFIILISGMSLTACQKSTPPTPPASSQTPAQEQSAAVASQTVTMQNMSFSPQNLVVKVGQTVTWTNQDQVPHTVTSDTGVFDSGQMASGDTFSFTFTEAGTFPYHCGIHPGMNGRVTVTE